MKIYITLIFLLILSAFGIGYYSYNISDNYNPTSFDRFEIRDIKRSFLRKHKPEQKFVYSELYPSKRYKNLLLPQTIFRPENRNVYFSKEDCFKYIDDMAINYSIEKVVSWERFRCGEIDRLPASFFQYPPFVHPSGSSYVFLFYKLLGEEKVTSDWLNRHLRYLKISELSYFNKKWKKLKKPFDVISELDEEGVENLVSYSNIFISKNKIFLMDWDIFSFFEGTYKVYGLPQFKNFLKKSKYIISINENKAKCLYSEGNICWNYSLSHIIDKTGYMNISMTVLMLIFAILSCLAIYGLISSERREDEKRKFALRILGHELRTPVTGMMLKLEKILKNIDRYDEDDQVEILKISSDAHRLRRLIEMSRNYLTASNKSGKKDELTKIPSMLDFCERFYDDYETLEIEVPEEDFSVNVDAYWLQVCLKNLIENAFFHGAEPVKLRVYEKNSKLLIEVLDEGSCEVETFEELSKEFFKGNKSRGTGLGLNIVKKILKDLKLKIEFENEPTCFRIIIERSDYGKSTNS